MLTEEQVIIGFHTLLKDSLAQARGEGLLTDDELESAEPTVQVAAPSLALFFAALGSTGEPASISSPDSSFNLAASNCPPSFSNAFGLWQACVNPIQRLSLEARHDLALLLCEKEPVSTPLSLQVARLAADLKGIALEILQRRTFQLRFQSDLNAALDSAVRPRTTSHGSDRSSITSSRTSTFQPPPMYSDGRPTEETKRAYEELGQGRMSQGATSPRYEGNLIVIRETLYSALADAVVETPSILTQLSQGPAFAAKAFFASTCLAILEVALTRVSKEGVRVVQLGRDAPRVIGIAETPEYLRPFLGKLVELSQALEAISIRDDETAMREASSGATRLTRPRIEKLKNRLIDGVSVDQEAGAGERQQGERDSSEQELRTLGNAINEMALGMTALPAFRERQAEAFKVLISVTSL